MIFLGIGSNLSSSFGDRFANIDLAVSLLKKNNIKLLKKSSYYETLSYPNKKDPKFINIVVSVETSLKPLDLMSILIKIEEQLERKRFKKNEPRTCDLDIIDYKNVVATLKFNNSELNIPHKNLSERNFVLLPLKEICPNWTHPKSNKNVDELINELSATNNDITKLP